MNLGQRRKILFLITKSNWGGAQKYVYDLATGLNLDKYEPVVVTGGNGNLISELQKANIKTLTISSLQRDISVTKEIKSLVELYKIIRQENPDILHVNSSKAGAIGTFLGRLTGVPKIIFTAHGWAFNEDRSSLAKLILKIFHWVTVILSHQTIAVSAAVKEQMNWPFVQSKMQVIHNGLRVPIYKERQAARAFLIEKIPQLNKFSSDYWSVTIGELHKTKQHHITIQALAQLKTSGLNLRHLIIGEGEERSHLENLVKSLDLQDSVFFTGKVDQAASYLKAFDLFILASISEALAYVVVEAAQAELPIIASNVGGLPEIITNEKEGNLVPSGDINTLAETIKAYINNPAASAQKAHAAYTKSKQFSLEKMLEETSSLYETKISSV